MRALHRRERRSTAATTSRAWSLATSLNSGAVISSTSPAAMRSATACSELASPASIGSALSTREFNMCREDRPRGRDLKRRENFQTLKVSVISQ
jgi:hypothetical protein